MDVQPPTEDLFFQGIKLVFEHELSSERPQYIIVGRVFMRAYGRAMGLPIGKIGRARTARGRKKALAKASWAGRIARTSRAPAGFVDLES